MMLKAIIETIEADLATIKLADGQSLKVPVASIHGSPKIGIELNLLISTGIADQPNTQDLARSLLNELIRPQ